VCTAEGVTLARISEESVVVKTLLSFENPYVLKVLSNRRCSERYDWFGNMNFFLLYSSKP
jgi:hypothetical protein